MLSTFFRRVLNLVLLVGFTTPLALHADVIFSNVSGTSPNANSGANILGVDYQPPYGSEAAEEFTPSADFSMIDAQVLLQGGALDVYLYSDNSGIPGREIAEATNEVNGPASSYSLETASFAPLDLTGGTAYWLVLGPADAASDGYWGNNGNPPSVPEALSSDGGRNWSTGTGNLQFEIDGTPLVATPEPSSLPLILAAAGCLLAGVQRARRTAKRLH